MCRKQTLSGQVVTSVSRVQPPQVHQQMEVLAALAGSDEHEPSTERPMLGIWMPVAFTSAIHCWTSVELIGGTSSRAGKPRLALKTPVWLEDV